KRVPRYGGAYAQTVLVPVSSRFRESLTARENPGFTALNRCTEKGERASCPQSLSVSLGDFPACDRAGRPITAGETPALPLEDSRPRLSQTARAPVPPHIPTGNRPHQFATNKNLLF